MPKPAPGPCVVAGVSGQATQVMTALTVGDWPSTSSVDLSCLQTFD